jgi:hypothetical protein
MVMFTRAHSCLLWRIESTFLHHCSNSSLMSVSYKPKSPIWSLPFELTNLNVCKVCISLLSMCVTYCIEPKSLDFIILINLIHQVFQYIFPSFCYRLSHIEIFGRPLCSQESTIYGLNLACETKF